MSKQTPRTRVGRVIRYRGQIEAVDDLLTIEEPLEIRLDFGPRQGRLGKSLSVTMRTPGDDFELVLGFLFAEGIIASWDDVQGVERCGPPPPGGQVSNVVRVSLEPRVEVDLVHLQRNFLSTSSCGVCGKASLEALPAPEPLAPIPTGPTLAPEVIRRWPAEMRKAQAVFEATGGVHAAGVFDPRPGPRPGPEAKVLHCREDVGRHNAVDKVVGAMLRAGTLPAGPRALVVSGRTSFEILQKAIRAGFPVVAAVGAPSSLALALAEVHSVTLIGFLGEDGFNVYAGSERVG